MRLWLPVCALLALGCSSDPSPADAGTDAPVARDDGADAASPPDVALEDHPDVVDAGGPDVVDAPAPVDAPDVVPADVPPDDAQPDAQLADAAEDRPDVVAVVDAGGSDAGPVTYHLDPPPPALEARVLYQRTPCAGTCSGPPDAIALDAACTRTGSRLSFSLRGCTFGPTSCVQITGLFPDFRSATGASVAIVGSATNQGQRLRVSSGATAGGRQSFHVQFAATPSGTAIGVTGVPGRTVDPAAADIWLLGCAVR